jgi:hypothetical protein
MHYVRGWKVLGWGDLKLAILQIAGRKIAKTDIVNSNSEIHNGVVALKMFKYFYD